MEMTPILILAAGQSRRMRGRDKLMEKIGGVAQLRRHAEFALQTSQPVYITLPSLTHARAACLNGLDVTVVPVPDAAEGMGTSLRAGITALPPFDAVLITLADLVEIDAADFQRLFNARVHDQEALIWRGSTDDGIPGHPVLFDQALRAEFATLSGDVGASAILKAQADRVRYVPLPGHHAICDLDKPEDWVAWRKAHE